MIVDGQSSTCDLPVAKNVLLVVLLVHIGIILILHLHADSSLVRRNV